MFVVLGFCVISCVVAAIRHFIHQKEQAALMSDAGVECEGSVTATTCHTEVDNYYLHYEFHVPASSSSHPGQANSEFGVKATGLYEVDQQVYQAHPATGLPKACTVRYVPANPYCNQLVKIGDGDRLSTIQRASIVTDSPGRGTFTSRSPSSTPLIRSRSARRSLWCSHSPSRSPCAAHRPLLAQTARPR